MNRKEFAYKVWLDVVRCVLTGMVIAACAGIVGALLGQFFYDSSMVFIPAVQGAVSALLISGSVSMLLSAFFFAVRKKDTKKVSGRWKKKFCCFGYPAVFLTVSVTILLMGSLFDLLYFTLQRHTF